MECKFVVNCASLIDWPSIICSIKNKPGTSVVPDRKKLSSNEYQKLFDMWDNANFNYSSAKWINYYPEDYGYTISNTFESIVKSKHIRSWISRIDPGYYAPWHWDIDDNETEYLKLGKLRRFICFIGEVHPGHVSIINNSCLHAEQEGNIYEWNSYNDWHAGVNAGLIPKFQYNYLGYEDSSTS